MYYTEPFRFLNMRAKTFKVLNGTSPNKILEKREQNNPEDCCLFKALPKKESIENP